MTTLNHGFLTMNDSGRWEIRYRDEDGDFAFGDQLTSGCVCEVLIGDKWIKTRIESSDGKYYAVTRGIRLCESLPARLPNT